MTPREIDLVVDLARLVKKYGPETFEALARAISSPDVSATLADALQAAARSAPTKPRGEQPSAVGKARSITSELDSLKETNPERHSLLVAFYNDFRESRVLPTMRD